MEVSEEEWRKNLVKISELTNQVSILQDSIRNISKENTMLKVDLAVVKEQLGQQMKKSATANQDESKIIAQRLDFKIKENEELLKQIDDLNLIINELRNYNKKYNELLKKTQELEKENLFLKKSLAPEQN